MAATTAPDVTRISLARGVPSPDLLPSAALAAAARAALERDPAAALLYGPAAGHAEVRAWVASRHGVAPERVVLTNGSLQGLALLLEALALDRLVVEQPLYDYSLLLAERHAPAVEGMPTLAEVEPERLPALLAPRHPGERVGVYVIPTFQNPSGRTASLERRRALADAAAAAGAFVIEDDPYRELSFAGPPPPTLLSLIGDGTAHLTSFTKTIAPGLRCGALVLPERLAQAVESAGRQLYVAPGAYAAATVAAYCAAGAYEPNLERVRALLAFRRDALCDALDAAFGAEIRFERPDGGYFLWAELPETRADAVAACAARRGLDVVPGGGFFLDGEARSRLRLAFSALSPQRARDAAERLAAAVQDAAA